MNPQPQVDTQEHENHSQTWTEDRHATTTAITHEIIWERRTQHTTFGEQNIPDGTGGDVLATLSDGARTRCDRAFAAGRGTWRHILAEEVAEAFAESDPALLRAELVQVAAVATAWCEALDRRTP